MEHSQADFTAILAKEGMMEKRGNRPSIVGPLILITAGILLLLNQAGRLPWGIWGTLWRFWPLIIVLIGIEVLLGAARSTPFYVGGLIVAVAVIVGVVLFAIYVGERPVGVRPPAGTEQVVEAMHDADSGQIKLVFALGTLDIGALGDSPSFVEGQVEYSRYSQPVQRLFRVREGKARFSLEARSRRVPFWLPGDATERWRLRFTPSIPLELEVDAGAGNVLLDLRDLKVTQLEVDGGAGRTDITFPAAAAFTRASVSAGVGDIIVHIPENVGARIRIDKALASVRVESARFSRSGDDYVSTNYHTAENKLELDLETAVGAITIR
jgi:hypothetical protein